MFTGIIEELGRLREMVRGPQSARLVLEGQVVLEGTKLGDSIAVNGVCLTVTELKGNTFAVDVMAETLNKTNLAELTVGERVNLERALRVGDRLGGHIVSGHIDGVGTIVREEHLDIAKIVEIEAPPAVLKYVVEKGSIAIDGVSLTVVKVTDRTFSVSLIPHTAHLTTLGFKQTGRRVNLEADVIGKYVERLLNWREPANGQGEGKITWEFLASHGFL